MEAEVEGEMVDMVEADGGGEDLEDGGYGEDYGTNMKLQEFRGLRRRNCQNVS